MSEAIELQDMSEARQPGEEDNDRKSSRSTASKKTGSCSSAIVHYRCAVVCLGVVCALLAITIRVLWLNYSILASQKSQLETNYSVLSSMQSLLGQLNTTGTEKDMLLTLDVTLDPDTAHNNLILSADGKQVERSDTWQKRPDKPKRFGYYVNVLGKQGFSSGRFYYEVQVSGKTRWTLGVVRESIDRKGEPKMNPANGFWQMWVRGSDYRASAVTLSLKEKPERVGVFVDYGAGLISFYDADRWSLIYSYKGVSFREKIYPFFSPDQNNDGKNSAPLVITPVSCAKS